jgi:hypothetical protein
MPFRNLIKNYSELKTLNYLLKRRDAREAEGARLEIVYSANNGIEGSNPSLSAITFPMQILLITGDL